MTDNLKQLEAIAAKRFPADEFHRIRNSVVFCEHEAKDSKGNPQKYDKEALEKIAARCNERILDTDDFAALSEGHTPNRDEMRQGMKMPDVLGFVGPFHVAKFGRRNPRWAIVADEWQFQDQRDKLRKLPRRSVELWLADKMEDRLIDPVAALGAETPRLDTGIRFARFTDGCEVEKYTAVAPAGGNTFVKTFGENKKEVYTMTDQEKREILDALSNMAEFEFLRNLMAKEESVVPEESVAPDTEAPIEEFQADEQVPPVDIGAEEEELQITEEEEKDMPEQIEQDNRSDKTDKTKEPDKLSREGAVERYTRLLAEHDGMVAKYDKLQAEHDALTASVASVLQESTDAKREARIVKLESSHAVDGNELRTNCLYSKGSELSDDAVDKVLTTAEKYCQPMPDVDRMLPDGALHRRESQTETERYEADRATRAIKLSDAHRARGEQTTYEACLAEIDAAATT